MSPAKTLQTIAQEVADQVKQQPPSVAVLGDMILDVTIEGVPGGIHAETQAPLLKGASSQESIGGAGNIALALSRLGVHVTLFGIVGADLPGRQLAETQGRMNFTSHLVTCRGWPTPRKQWIYERAGDAVQIMQRIDFDRPLPPEAREQLLGEVRARYRSDTQVLIVADHGLGAMGTETLEAIRIAQHGGAKVVAIPRTRLDHYRRVDVLVPNPTEMRELVGLEGKGEAQGAAARYAEEHGVNVYLTQGSKGLFVCCPAIELVQIVPTKPIEHPQKMGARDMVVAIIALGSALKLPPLHVAELANAFSYLVVQQRGNGTVFWNDLFEELGIHAEPR